MDHEQARRFENQLAEKEAALNAHVHTCGNIQSVAVAEQYCDDPCAKPYRTPTVLERIEKELSHHEHERERGILRSQGLSELASLLRAHPEVARILELKAELGL